MQYITAPLCFTSRVRPTRTQPIMGVATAHRIYALIWALRLGQALPYPLAWQARN